MSPSGCFEDGWAELLSWLQPGWLFCPELWPLWLKGSGFDLPTQVLCVTQGHLYQDSDSLHSAGGEGLDHHCSFFSMIRPMPPVTAAPIPGPTGAASEGQLVHVIQQPIMEDTQFEALPVGTLYQSAQVRLYLETNSPQWLKKYIYIQVTDILFVSFFI